MSDTTPSFILANKQIDLAQNLSNDSWELVLDQLIYTLLKGTDWESRLANQTILRKKLVVLNDIPMKCKAVDCEYAEKCPVLKALPAAKRASLIGTDCRVEKLFITEEFAQRVKELNIGPDDTTDILNLAMLIGYLVFKKRISFDFAINGMTQRKVDAVNQRTGDVYYTREPSKLIDVEINLTKQILALENQLVASRRDRLTVNRSKDKTMEAALQHLLQNSQLNALNSDSDYIPINEEE